MSSNCRVPSCSVIDRDLLRRCDVVSHWHLQTGIDAKLMHQHRCWDSDCKASAHGNFILLPNHGLLSLAKEVSGNFGTKNTTRVVLKNAQVVKIRDIFGHSQRASFHVFKRVLRRSSNSIAFSDQEVAGSNPVAPTCCKSCWDLILGSPASLGSTA